ncbi:Efflux RND transporter permease subunit [Sulfidibacter corallicola]|uniref:Efflux RND transporter permease subunit n=1 Tax=Sulfidibacter corallicola TaxID=2818388 RepID=A0A8A4TT77_SULCO|nr:efflux RND transporter permease subunit [Sulfidibacter corallicola]QTD52288.1 efflux RND transporter permease subunit [Sulfidibacter corallicola]
MSLSSIAFRYKRLMFTMVVALMVYGVVSYFKLPAREDPKITIREALVQTSHPGMPADRVEALITTTLEEAIIEMPEIKEVRSISQPGLSIIHVEVEDIYFDLGQIWDDLRQKIEPVVVDLPEGTATPLINDSFGDVAVVTAALHGEDYHMGELFDLAQHIRTQVYAVEGTEKVELLGVQEERIFLDYSDAVLARFDLTPSQLAGILRAQNIIQPGGELDTGERAFLIEPTGNFSSVAEIGETLIPIPGQETLVPLRDLVAVRHGFVDPPRQKAYFNGEPAIILAITMHDTTNVLSFSPELSAKIDAINQTLPAGAQLDIVTYQAEQVANAVYGVTSNVLQTLAIVLIVVILFLGIRTGLIVGAIVPTVMLITLSMMSFTGIFLERMSLATLIISLGLLVDNGIVIAEDFLRGLEEGETRKHALIRSGRELAIPLLTSSLTTILMFMPLMLADHVAGEFTRNVSLIILYTLSISWLVALTLTPTLCYFFIKVPKKRDDVNGEAPRVRDLTHRLFDSMNRGYRKALQWTLRHRPLFLVAMFAVLIAAIGLMSVVRKEFFPNSDRTQVLIYADFPPDSTARTTDKRMREVSEFIDDDLTFPHVKSLATYVGFGGPRFVLSLTPIDPSPYKGFMVLNIDAFENIDATMDTLRHELWQRFPDVNFRVNRMFLGPTDSSVIEIQVKGPDADFLYATAKRMEGILRDVDDTISVRNDWEGRVSRLRIEVDQHRARRAGVTSQDIANGLQAYFSGRPISTFREGDDQYPIVLQARSTERYDLNRVQSLQIYPTSGGAGVPLMAVAEVETVNDFARYAHENLVRTITVSANNPLMSAEVLKPVVDERIRALAAEMPPNHAIEYDGVIEMSADGQAALRKYLPLCVGLIFWVLMAQFNSFRRTGIIFITLPLLIIGAALGLFVMSAPLGFMVTLGIYSLAGILANNAIVLIDRIDLERAQGIQSEWMTVVDASVRRLRPILMSSGTTILGLLPLILSKDVLFYGMAVAIAGGLLVGTVLTLGLVPVLYTYFFGIEADVAQEELTEVAA